MKQVKGYFFSITAAVCFGLQPLLADLVYSYDAGSRKASILAAFEPVTGILAGTLFLGEPFKWNNVLGTLFVIVSTLVLVIGGSPSEERCKERSKKGKERFSGKVILNRKDCAGKAKGPFQDR